MTYKTMELEICAGDLASVKAAADGGATRVEICCALPLGGLTPQQSSLSLSEKYADKIRRHVLLRPRQGDFLYDDEELECMMSDIQSPTFRNADGYVIGILDADGNVDMERTARLMAAAGDGVNKSFTFHRAFDMTADPFRALEDIVSLGFHRILTSGCAATAEAGIPLLKELQKRAEGRITIMAGAGINPGNVEKIMRETGITSFHASCSTLRNSRINFRNLATTMAAGSNDEYSYPTTDTELVRKLRYKIFHS